MLAASRGSSLKSAKASVMSPSSHVAAEVDGVEQSAHVNYFPEIAFIVVDEVSCHTRYYLTVLIHKLSWCLCRLTPWARMACKTRIRCVVGSLFQLLVVVFA